MQIEVNTELLGIIARALQSSGGDLNKVSDVLAETIGLHLLADISDRHLVNKPTSLKYIIVKVESNAVKYGKAFDNEIDAIRAAVKLNASARQNGWADIVQYMVLPKGAE